MFQLQGVILQPLNDEAATHVAFPKGEVWNHRTSVLFDDDAAPVSSIYVKH